MSDAITGFVAVPRRAVFDRALYQHPAAFRLLTAICNYVGKEGWADVGPTRLASDLGVQRQNIYPAVRRLQTLGYLERRGRRWRVLYQGALGERDVRPAPEESAPCRQKASEPRRQSDTANERVNVCTMQTRLSDPMQTHTTLPITKESELGALQRSEPPPARAESLPAREGERRSVVVPIRPPDPISNQPSRDRGQVEVMLALAVRDFNRCTSDAMLEGRHTRWRRVLLEEHGAGRSITERLDAAFRERLRLALTVETSWAQEAASHPSSRNRRPFRYFMTSPEIIRIGVLMDVRARLRLCHAEDLLLRHGIDIPTRRCAVGGAASEPVFAADIRRRRIDRTRAFAHWHWLVDGVFLKICRGLHKMWRAVDHEGESATALPSSTEGPPSQPDHLCAEDRALRPTTAVDDPC